MAIRILCSLRRSVKRAGRLLSDDARISTSRRVMTTHRHEDAGSPEPTAPAPAPQGQQPWLHDLAICVDGNGTALSESDGSMTGRGAHGFFVDDQRVRSRFTVGLGAAHLVQVAHSSRGARSEFFTSARGLGDSGPDPTVELRRRRALTGGTLREQVIVASRASQTLEAPLVIRIGGDGADIGPVKAGVATGEALEAHVGPGGDCGVDGGASDAETRGG